VNDPAEVVPSSIDWQCCLVSPKAMRASFRRQIRAWGFIDASVYLLESSGDF